MGRTDPEPQNAVLTAPGRGAVAVLVLNGPDARARVAALAAGSPPALEPGTLRLLRLRSAGGLVDEALVVTRSPERIELHLHGSPPLVRRLAAELGLAPAGEPPPAGGAPALEERALGLCAAAPCEAAARILLDQAEGALRRALGELAAAPFQACLGGLEALLERGRAARRALEPARVVLAGPVNAGKSTLFNALVGRERVVVSPAEGTTRDVLVERVQLGAYAADVCDTAGDRDLERAGAGRDLERAGQELGRRARGAADLVLWLRPPGAPEPPAAAGSGGPALRVLPSRCDELPPEVRASLSEPIAALAEPAAARAAVERAFHGALGLAPDPWRPGAAVPFDPGSRELVARCLRAARGRRREHLAALLAGA